MSSIGLFYMQESDKKSFKTWKGLHNCDALLVMETNHPLSSQEACVNYD